ncbi:MAG: putative zinc-binding peptidase [Hyphomicrobium sp.]
MQTYKCGACGNTVYFENIQCLRCGNPLGFRADKLEIRTLSESGNGLYREYKKGSGTRLRYCANMAHGVCNWLVPADSPSPFCTACELNRTIPNLADPANVLAWGEFERAKKRLIYSLLRLGLSLDGAAMGKAPLNFDFVNDALTGHLDGVITIAVGEADSVERERQRKAMAETYRSLLGHLRHESGHYYWMLLIDGTRNIDRFRGLFGDERENYGAALDRHHSQGPPADWALRYVSAYASSHPWEDWAETWAHYLHMIDALDTAAVHRSEPRSGGFAAPWPLKSLDVYSAESFDSLIKRWVPLTLALNDINRSMGHDDFYPFVIPELAVTKLAFVHRVVRRAVR